jgi:replication initiation and membrane attachment protein DnaB
MENYLELVEQLQRMGVENPSESDVKSLAKLVLEAYQVEIFRQELKKVKAMRKECAQKARETITNFQPTLGTGRNDLVQIVGDAILDEVEIPELTHTVRYMVAASY